MPGGITCALQPVIANNLTINMKKRIILSMALALAATLQLTAYTAQEAVNKFVSHSSLRYASVGVNVIDLDSAKSIASYRPDQANITASTMKTVVSSAALGLLGPHFRFETPVYIDGEIRDNCLYGDIIVKGMGDPTLGSVFMPNQANIVDEIIGALSAQGIARVEGNIICDDSYYGYPYYDEDWDVGDLAYNYGAAVHALNFHDNLMTVSCTMDSRGRVSRSSIKPPVPGVKVISRCRGSRGRNAITPYLDYSTPALVFTGETTARTYRNTYANPTPAPMLADSLERAIRNNGIQLSEPAEFSIIMLPNFRCSCCTSRPSCPKSSPRCSIAATICLPTPCCVPSAPAIGNSRDKRICRQTWMLWALLPSSIGLNCKVLTPIHCSCAMEADWPGATRHRSISLETCSR